MDDMLNILTKGVGAELGKPIRISYFEKKRSIDKHLKDRNTSLASKEIIYDSLALTVFHDKVIIPLHGSLNFMSTAMNYGIANISMSTYSIDSAYNEASDKCVKQFFAILSSYNIDIRLLTFSNPIDFLESVLDKINEWKKDEQ